MTGDLNPDLASDLVTHLLSIYCSTFPCRAGHLGADHLTFEGGGGWVIYGQQDFFFLATWWVGYFFTAVQEFFSITFVLHTIFFFRQALAGNFFSKSPTPSLKS